MIAQNPFVFAMAKTKMQSFIEDQVGEFPEQPLCVRIPRSFDMFNRRSEYPFEVNENPLRIDPAEERYD